MDIGERLRSVREEKKLSQGDIERRTGLYRCYISRLENGHIVPVVETLEKFARALEIPLYQLLYDGDKPPSANIFAAESGNQESEWGSSGKEGRFLRKLCGCLAQMSKEDREILISFAQRATQRRKATTGRG